MDNVLLGASAVCLGDSIPAEITLVIKGFIGIAARTELRFHCLTIIAFLGMLSFRKKSQDIALSASFERWRQPFHLDTLCLRW
jgi:hypothetical protein